MFEGLADTTDPTIVQPIFTYFHQYVSLHFSFLKGLIEVFQRWFVFNHGRIVLLKSCADEPKKRGDSISERIQRQIFLWRLLRWLGQSTWFESKVRSGHDHGWQSNIHQRTRGSTGCCHGAWWYVIRTKMRNFIILTLRTGSLYVLDRGNSNGSIVVNTEVDTGKTNTTDPIAKDG